MTVLENSTVRTKVGLFTTGLVQVLLVAVNSYQIPHQKWLGAFIVGFLISLIWSWNVKRIAFGSTLDRFMYAFGAATGTLAGMFLSWWWYEWL